MSAEVSTNGTFHIWGNKLKCCETTSAISLLTRLGRTRQREPVSCLQLVLPYIFVVFPPEHSAPAVAYNATLKFLYCFFWFENWCSSAYDIWNAESVLRHTGCAVWIGRKQSMSDLPLSRHSAAECEINPPDSMTWSEYRWNHIRASLLCANCHITLCVIWFSEDQVFFGHLGRLHSHM